MRSDQIYIQAGVVFRRNDLKLPVVKLRCVFIEVGVMTRNYALHKLYAALHKASRDEERCSLAFYNFFFSISFGIVSNILN